jgi:wobble nucleotide-excising tRNase
MLEKIVRIRNVGRFRDCCAVGDVTFRKLTLIYAENGRGKTTLCAILRSLQGGQPELIGERKTLGAAEPASIQLLVDGSIVSFANNAWTAVHPNLAIFDSVFVHDNVYAGDYVDHEHKRNLYRVIVGSEGVRLAREVERLDDLIRAASAAIRDARAAVERHVPREVTPEAYLEWAPIADIDVRIQQTSTEMTRRERALEMAVEIQSKDGLGQVALPTLPPDFTAVIGKQLNDIAEDAEERVRQQIADHQMGDHGEPWLSEGLGYVRDDLCPFCGQSLRASALLAAYRTQFSVAYASLKQEVAHLSQRITDAIAEASLTPAQQTLSTNAALVEFWRQFAEVDLPGVTFLDVQAKYAALRDQALSLAQRKQQNPAEAVVPDDEFRFALRDVASLRESLEVYNTTVAECNKGITRQKVLARQGGDSTALQTELTRLEAVKTRFEPDTELVCQAYRDALLAKAGLEERKEEAKRQLSRYCEGILRNYEEHINEYLDLFGTGFRIANTRHSYRGGTPSSQFQIQINGTPVSLGDAGTPPGTPCFRTTLSSGDRSALAFAFFLAALQDANMGDTTLVLDDPFTSLDRFRRVRTQQLIETLAGAARQVIVLSHDPSFLKLVYDAHLQKSEVRTLHLCRDGEDTALEPLDIDAATRDVYLENHDTLLRYYRRQDGRPLDVARTIRPFLEGFLRFHFPGHFLPTEWLGDFLQKIRDADPGSGLCHAQQDLRELTAINEYSRGFHHEGPNATPIPTISPTELHGFVERALRLCGGY